MKRSRQQGPIAILPPSLTPNPYKESITINHYRTPPMTSSSPLSKNHQHSKGTTGRYVGCHNNHIACKPNSSNNKAKSRGAHKVKSVDFHVMDKGLGAKGYAGVSATAMLKRLSSEYDDDAVDVYDDDDVGVGEGGMRFGSRVIVRIDDDDEEEIGLIGSRVGVKLNGDGGEKEIEVRRRVVIIEDSSDEVEEIGSRGAVQNVGGQKEIGAPLIVLIDGDEEENEEEEKVDEDETEEEEEGASDDHMSFCDVGFVVDQIEGDEDWCLVGEM